MFAHSKGTEQNITADLKHYSRDSKKTVTLRKESCQLGMAQVKWFSRIYSEHDVSADPSKVEVIKSWARPNDKTEVKAFLQTLQLR